MRTWRVGSISMGILLFLLGILLMLGHFFHIDSTTLLVTWWPIILISLGIEILLFLFLSKQDKPYMSYDFLSIIFVGFLGMFTLGLTMLTTTGVLDKVNEWTQMTTQSLNLPAYETTIKEDIERIVVQTNNHSLNIQDTSSHSVNVFGTYEARIIDDHAPIQSVSDYLLVEKIGDTLFIQMKEQYNDLFAPFDQQLYFDTTIVVPSNVSLDVMGKDNLVTLSPRKLLNTWAIHQVAQADIYITEKVDMLIKAEQVHDLIGETWEKGKYNDDDEPYIRSGTMKIGSGKHQLTITDAQTVSVIKH